VADLLTACASLLAGINAGKEQKNTIAVNTLFA
jgi:hypothetical protein